MARFRRFLKKTPHSLFLILTASTVLFFQNCSRPGFQVNPGLLTSSSLAPSSQPGVIPEEEPTEVPYPISLGCNTSEECRAEEKAAAEILSLMDFKATANCFNDPSVDACLFYRNPMFGRTTAFSQYPTNALNLSAQQNYGVKLDTTTFNTSTGCLENTSYSILKSRTSAPGSTTRAVACYPNREFKKAYNQDVEFDVSALMVHYYINFQVKYMTEFTGAWYAKDKNIRVTSQVDDRNSFPNASNNAYFQGVANGEIVMGVFRNPALGSASANEVNFQETALSAEVTLHEAAHANIYHAGGGVRVVDENRVGSSCRTPAGCYGGLNEGQADYSTLILFPKDSSVGNYVWNDVNGLPIAGSLKRNYRIGSIKGLTDQTAGQQGGNGIYTSAAVWASFWYESRLKAEQSFGARGIRAVDQTFTETLPAIAGNDVLKTACQKAVVTSESVENGLVKNILSAECTRRMVL